MFDAVSREFQLGWLWSLADVINGSLSGLCELCAQLMLESVVRARVAPISLDELEGEITAVEREKLLGWLGIAESIGRPFEWSAVPARIAVIRKRLNHRFTQRDFATEARVLLETIKSEMSGHLIYRYPKEQGAVLLAWTDEWAPTVRAFPSAEHEIKAAVDLWALHHPTAAVFHLMRVLEHGIRTVADDLGLTFEFQQWYNIINEIESAIKKEAATLPKGALKNERLEFLAQAAKEFAYFKDGWRNHVSHNRAQYDAYQARSVLEHVRTFMNHLSSRLSEAPTLP
ncbi:hypothetical protein [Roseomonas sp. BN140053]|uniref:hypothetical protein n=1 Tax=Roseomonas sp. BN140053 TaxID=3391898 RepID=UPI0039EA621F